MPYFLIPITSHEMWTFTSPFWRILLSHFSTYLFCISLYNLIPQISFICLTIHPLNFFFLWGKGNWMNNWGQDLGMNTLSWEEQFLALNGFMAPGKLGGGTIFLSVQNKRIPGAAWSFHVKKVSVLHWRPLQPFIGNSEIPSQLSRWSSRWSFPSHLPPFFSTLHLSHSATYSSSSGRWVSHCQ